MLKHIVKFFLENKVITYLLLLAFIGWGLMTSPFEATKRILPDDSVSVDAIPDIGENQQIVYTQWQGRSPQDIEDQITYPLTTALLGIPGVKSVRSNSMFGFSNIYVIFDDKTDFYWSRSRILEKLNALPRGLLPEGVQPSLGPDATALGQIFWYTLEGRDAKGNVTGGWDLHELRSIQDYYVKYGLSAAEGVAEVASVGGYVKEYQIDIDPDAMRNYNITLSQVMRAVRNSNIDVGAKTMEINRVEYFIRGLGYLNSIEDIENTEVASPNNVPVLIRDIARVNIGPAIRRGALDKSGAEVTGGVVIARYGANPMEVIENVKAKIEEIAPGLPSKTLKDGRVSQVSVVPFYDRTELINETIGTLQEALWLEILITIIVVIIMLMNLRASLLVSMLLPVAVLMCFIAMRYFGVDANIVALSGIAIAIGTMVDMAIVMVENIMKHLEKTPPEANRLQVVYDATMEVGSAVITAVATTIISFLPVFTMIAAEGKLFKPLAFTKTFALVASIIVSICFIPAIAHSLFGGKKKYDQLLTYMLNGLLVALGIYALSQGWGWISGFIIAIGIIGLLGGIKRFLPEKWHGAANVIQNILYAIAVAVVLAREWMPLGVSNTLLTNIFFVGIIIAVLLLFFRLIIRFYENILRLLLKVKWVFLLLIGLIIFAGFRIMQNTGKEFMPSLSEGSFLLMPTSMPHSGMEENTEILRMLDMAVTAIPEIETVVGKLGRAESALDPAPISMFENVIQYKSEYKTDAFGKRLRYKVNAKGEFIRNDNGELIPDKRGKYFRQWRDEIQTPDDIWNEIVRVTKLPGVTSAPKLQPIETRLVMLQTGMRAPMGIKVKGPDLEDIQDMALQLEEALQTIPGVKKQAVFAERIVGKPYLEIELNRDALALYGLSVQTVQNYIAASVGGMPMTTTVEGRERYPVRIRYPRAQRSDPSDLNQILINLPDGNELPLGELATISYEQGPQSIKSEDGFLVGYVLFDKLDGYDEIGVVETAQKGLSGMIDRGEIIVPPGVSYSFAGNYENQVRANKRLALVIPLALALIFVVLYLQFKSIPTAFMVFTGVFVAFAGGFIMLWLYKQQGFLNFSIGGENLRDLFQMKTYNLSVAVWVGFLALFGIATDDGVLVGTYLKQSFERNNPTNKKEIVNAVVEAGKKRVRPAMMTTATTLLALLPVLSSAGRGADIMIPMAIPSFGGMALQIITMFTVPILYAMWKETGLRFNTKLKKYE